jgi:schlafen family protein
MPFTESQEALEALLGGYKFDSSKLEEFLNLHQEEDQHLEYKNGKITGRNTRKEANRAIRQAMSGFANSEGGVLVVGIDEGKPRGISPCHSVGAEPLDKWAEGLLHDMAPFFSPLPRIHVVNHPSGPVLVLAVARSPVLVPCVESGRIGYFLRLNQSTLPAPDFLLSDLVLGRRRQPAIDVTVSMEQPPPLLREPKCNSTLYVTVENVGLVHVESLNVGIVSWVPANIGPEINRHLMSYLEHPERVHLGGYDWVLRHLICKPIDPSASKLPPFAKASFKTNDLLLLFSATQLRVEAAIYVVPKDSSPLWFGFIFRCGRAPFADKPYIETLCAQQVINRRVRVQVADTTSQVANTAPAADG